MRLLFACFLMGCGSGVDPLIAPMHSERASSEGGKTTVTKVPESPVLRSCTLEYINAFKGSSGSWRREMVDAAGRPRLYASSFTAVDEYAYDAANRVVHAPAYLWFEYDGALLTAHPRSAATAYLRLDARGRIVGEMTDPKSEPHTTIAYDDHDRVIEQKTSGSTLTYRYDAAGFLVEEAGNWTSGAKCHRTWSWTHDATEAVSVRNDAGFATESCAYTFDGSNRLVNARCRNSSAAWTYARDSVTMAISGSITIVERATGTCAWPTRASLVNAFLPVTNDPRPSPDQLRRLSATPIPAPQHQCMYEPFGPGEG